MASTCTGFIDVYVKLSYGKVITILLSGSNLVEEIYKHVAKEENKREDLVLIKYTGKVLNRKHTLGYLGVRKETILKAEIITVKTLNININSKDETISSPLELQVDNVTSIKTLKKMVCDKTDLSTEKQILKVKGVEVKDGSLTLIDVGVKDKEIIELFKRPDHLVVESSSEETAETKIDLSDEAKNDVIESFQTEGKKVEVVFAFDTTGSMYSVLEKVRTNLKDTCTRLLQDIPDIRIGIMAVGDYCDYTNYVVKYQDLSSEAQTIVNFVKDVPSTGGGDTPEAYEWALRKAQELDWSEDSAKALVMIGDSGPHPISYTDQNINWSTELDILKGMGVKVYGVQAMQSNEAKVFYSELADRTGGAYITFNNFNIITDMFLAVCYREANPDQLEAFCEEVENREESSSEGASSKSELKEDIKQMLNQMKADPKPKEDAPKKRHCFAWWDPKLDKASPQYSYDANTNSWGPYRKKRTDTRHPTETETVPSYIDEESRLKRNKTRISLCCGRKKPSDTGSEGKKCVVM